MTNRFSVVPLVFALLSASPCAAQTEASPIEAKRFFREGNTFAKEGHYLRALEAFEKSYALMPKAVVLFNMGMCFKALDRLDKSVEYLQRYLSEAGDAPKPDLRSEAEEGLKELEETLSSRNFEETPDDNETTEAERTDSPTTEGMRKSEVAPEGPATTAAAETETDTTETPPAPSPQEQLKQRRFFYSPIRAVWFSGALVLLGSGGTAMLVTYFAWSVDNSRRDELIPLNNAGGAVLGIGLAGAAAFLISGPLVRKKSRETRVSLRWSPHMQGLAIERSF